MINDARISVSTGPGAYALTVMPCGPNSTADPSFSSRDENSVA